MQNGEFEHGEYLNAVAIHQAIMAALADGDVINEIPQHVSKRGHNLSIYRRDESSKAVVMDGLPSNDDIRAIYLETLVCVKENMLEPLEMAAKLKEHGHYDHPPTISEFLSGAFGGANYGSDDEALDIDAPDISSIDERMKVQIRAYKQQEDEDEADD